MALVDVLTAVLGFAAIIGAGYALTYLADALGGRTDDAAWFRFGMAVCGVTWAVLGLAALQLWGSA